VYSVDTGCDDDGNGFSVGDVATYASVGGELPFLFAIVACTCNASVDNIESVIHAIEIKAKTPPSINTASIIRIHLITFPIILRTSVNPFSCPRYILSCPLK